MTTESQKPLSVFCSYSRKDEEYLNELRTWLRGLERQGLIEWWHDREISPGWEWEEAIDKNLRSAEIILLLVSPAFMGSDYVYEKEISKAVERHERGEARVIPIILRPADWEWPPLNKLQAVPRDAKPITTWANQDEGWLDVVRGIRRAIEELLLERQERPAKQRYRQAVEEAWTDKNNVSTADAVELSALASKLGLSTDTAADIEHKVMGDAKEAILERQEQKERQKRLEKLYARARKLHQDGEWQAVVDTFEQIRAEEADHSDPEGLLLSAREELSRITPANVGRIRLLRTLGGHTYSVRSVAFSPDGSLLASASDDRSVHLWQVEDGRLLRTLKGHTDLVRSVAFSRDGSLLASGSSDHTVRLWRVKDGKPLYNHWHTSWVWSVAFSPDGELLASGSEDKTAKLWRVKGSSPLRTLGGHTYSVRSVAFSPDGSLLASASDDRSVHLWQVEDGRLLRTLKGHTKFVTGVMFSPDGSLLASASDDATVRLWRVANGELLRTLEGHAYRLEGVAFSRDGSLLASGANAGRVRLWQVEDGRLLRTLKGHTDLVRSVAFSPDGQLLASGSRDHTVQLWGMT